MILYKNVYQVKTMCCVQLWLLTISSFLSYVPLIVFLAHLSHSDKVSFCDQSLSVFRLLTINLNDNSS